jgi:hypothetical protein
MKSTTRNWLILILCLCALVRFVHYEAISQSAFIDFPFYAVDTDMAAYWQWSDRILEGDLLGRETYHPMFEWMVPLGDEETWHRWWGDHRIFQQEPVYPYLVAAGRALGLSIAGIIFVQLLLGSLQPLVTFWLTRLVFRQDAVALIAAAIAGLYGPLIFSQGVLLRDWTGPLLESLGLIALLYAAQSGRAGSWFLPGIIFGIALMTRSAVLAFVPFMFLWIVWLKNEQAVQRLRCSVIACGGLLVGFGPLLLRNIWLGVGPLKITNRLPEGIVSGNAADTFPLGMTVPASMPEILEKAQGSALVAGMETIKTHGGDWTGFFQMQWLKIRALLDPLEISNNVSFDYGRDISPVLKLLPDYGWLLPLAVLGVVLVIATRRIDYRHGLVLLFGLATALALIVNLALGRYRLAISSCLFVYAAWAVWRWWCWLKDRQYRKAELTAGLLLSLAGLQHVVIPIQVLRESTFFMLHPMSHYMASKVYLGRGQPGLAMVEWELMQTRALKIGDAAAADAAVEKQQSLHSRMVTVTAATGNFDQAGWHLSELERLFSLRIDSSMRDFAIGVLNAQLGLEDEAVERLERFIKDYPDYAEAGQARQLISQIGGHGEDKPADGSNPSDIPKPE